jgi:hypothetical protein
MDVTAEVSISAPHYQPVFILVGIDTHSAVFYLNIHGMEISDNGKRSF